MTWKLPVGGFLLLAVALASCSSSDVGTGINTVDREYSATVKQAHDAALATLKEEDLAIETDKSDNLGANIVAKRKTSEDNKVLVEVKGLETRKSRVSVRVQPGDKNQATMIQDKIERKLEKMAD
jgi:hypothetical protein